MVRSKSKFTNVRNIIKGAREKAKEKAEETRKKMQRLGDMQLFVDKCLIKRKLLYRTLKSKASDCEKTILEKGALVYIERLEIIELVKKDLEKLGIDYRYVTSKVSQKERGEVCNWFKEDPANKVVILSACGGESLNLNFTNEMILYNVPKGAGKYAQLIGRVDRGFGKYNEFLIHFIIIKDTIDQYMQILLSSKKEMETELLEQDVIPIKEVVSFEQQVMLNIRKDLLWKERKRKAI